MVTTERDRPTTVSTANEALLESWELALLQKSPATIAVYRYNLTYFERWLVATGRPESAPGDLAAVSRQDAERWLNELRSKGYAEGTRRTRWIALRSFYGWLEEEEGVPSPVARVTMAPPVRTPPKVMEEDDLRRLLKACQGRDFDDRRDLAIIRVMVACGLRRSELAGIQVGDIHLQSRTLVVKGKGGKGRVARFDAETALALDRYRRVRGRHRCAESPWLWLGRQGRLSREGVRGLVKRRAAQAGLGHLHPHRLRHSWAHLMKKRGVSDEDLMELGGWSDASVMRWYASGLAQERALAAYDAANPMGFLE